MVSFDSPLPQLLLVGLRPRLDREADDRARELHRFEHDGVLRIADRVTRADALQPDGGGDIARVHLLDLLTLVRVHLEETPDTLGAATA